MKTKHGGVQKEHSERAGKRKAREKQHEARKKANGTNATTAPLGAHPPPGRGGAGAVRGGAVAAKAESKADSTVT
jgi:hypothetical protein